MRNASGHEGENERQWKRCEQEQVQLGSFLEVSGCSHVKQLQRIGTIWKTSFPGTPPIAWKLLP